MSLTYTTGDPSHLTGGTTAAMSDISGPFADIKTFLTDGAASIGTTLIANNAVTAAKIEAQQAWQTLAMTGFSTSLSYMKDSLGFVNFRQDVLTATSNGALGLGTLPAGYRPVNTQQFIIHFASNMAVNGMLSITSAGVMTTTLTTATTCIFVGRFRAEN